MGAILVNADSSYMHLTVLCEKELPWMNSRDWMFRSLLTLLKNTFISVMYYAMFSSF